MTINDRNNQWDLDMINDQIILHAIYAYVMILRISEDLTTMTAMVGEGKEITDWCPWAQQLILAGAKLILMDLDGSQQQILHSHAQSRLGEIKWQKNEVLNQGMIKTRPSFQVPTPCWLHRWE